MAEQSVVERFRAWLREHELPVTSQRLAIAHVLLDADHLVSAEDIAVMLASRGIKTGTATVYRTLDVLVASGLAVERDFAEGFRRFERARERSQQNQLLCTTCGRVDEFRDDRLEPLTSRVAASLGFTLERHRLVIYGVCGPCGESASRRPSAAAAHSA